LIEKTQPSSSWNLPPTPKQVRAITKLCAQLGYQQPHEEKVKTRWEARNLLAGLREERKRRQSE